MSQTFNIFLKFSGTWIYHEARCFMVASTGYGALRDLIVKEERKGSQKKTRSNSMCISVN